MPGLAGTAALATALLLSACSHHEAAQRPAQETKAMNGAVSPTGEAHPGEILNDDKVDGRTWKEKAAAVPQTVAWVREGARWTPVARYEITGTPDRRRITSFAADGRMLETTVMAVPPPQAPPPSQPIPVPMPMPESTKK